MIDQKGEMEKIPDGNELLSLASHELRTTLSIIKWYTEMLLDGDCGPLNDDQIKYLKTIEGSNQRAIDLIRSLLNVSRLSLDTFCINPVETDLSTVVKDILIQNKPRIESKKLQISEEYTGTIPGVLPTLMVDRQVATVLIRSLISNAINFSEVGTTINVKINKVNQNTEIGQRSIKEDCLIVTVSDTGIGIPKNEQEKVFTKFFRASNITEGDGTGGGLSLYIVSLVLHRVGGEVWFSSEENKGATFYLTFPLTGMTKKTGLKNLD